MKVFQYAYPLKVVFIGLVFWSVTIKGQGTDSLRFEQCFQQINLPWLEQSNSNPDAEIWPDMVLLRTIQPGNTQELYFELNGQFFKSRRQPVDLWSKIEPSGTELGGFVATHWSALRDDQVKPFRYKSTHNEKSENTALPENQAAYPTSAVTTLDDTLAQVPEDLTYTYVLFFRNICVERQFNRKDLDDNWAQENATFIFNQTLKLTKVHQMMDALFVDKS